MECPISEDVESEEGGVGCDDPHHNNDYLSDYSSSSNFSFHKKKMSFDLSRLIDRLEPLQNGFDYDSSSSFLGGGSKHYYSNVNETIKEEDDEEAIQPPGAGELYTKLKA